MVEEKKSLAVDLDGFDLEQDYYVAWHRPPTFRSILSLKQCYRDLIPQILSPPFTDQK